MLSRKQLIALLAAILINGDTYIAPAKAVEIAQKILEAADEA